MIGSKRMSTTSFRSPRRCTHRPKNVKSNSSKRVHCAALARTAKVLSFTNKKKKSERRRILTKRKKLNKKLIEIKKTKIITSKCIDRDVIKNEYVVVNGSNKGDTLCCTSNLTKLVKSVRVLHVMNGDLFVPEAKDWFHGLVYRTSQDNVATFTLCPRRTSLTRTGLLENPGKVNDLLTSFKCIEKVQRMSAKRGNGKPVFGEAKYIGCYGNQTQRSTRGTKLSYHFRFISDECKTNTLNYATNLEHLVREFSEREAAQLVREARSICSWGTLGRCNIYSSFAFGRNVYLPAHEDMDFTYSIVSVLKNADAYRLEDECIAYFCFPNQGIAVPMKPGDVMIFNPCEPHCISSRCKREDDILCISLYLKSAMVGGNDNSVDLTKEQEETLAIGLSGHPRNVV